MGFTLKGNKFLPFRVDPFSEGVCCAGMHTIKIQVKIQSVNHKSCLALKNNKKKKKTTKTLPNLSSPVNDLESTKQNNIN